MRKYASNDALLVVHSKQNGDGFPTDDFEGFAEKLDQTLKFLDFGLQSKDSIVSHYSGVKVIDNDLLRSQSVPRDD